MSATTVSYTKNQVTTTISLPPDLNWEDEFKWSSILQSQEYGITGSLIVEDWVKQAGRPISLVGADDRSWITKTTLESLQTLMNLPGQQATLTLSDTRVFTVLMDNSSGPAIESKAVFDLFPTQSSDLYIINKLKFICKT